MIAGGRFFMRITVLAAVGLLNLSIAAAASAQTAPAAPAPAAQPVPAAAPAAAAAPEVKKNDPDKLICRMEEVTGSRLTARRVCHTAADWAAISRDAQDATLETQLRSKQSNPNSGG
jgi:hypothetical protein